MFKNCVLKVSVDTQKWVKSATVRAIKTMAQTAVSVIAVGSTVANVVSILTSVAGLPEVKCEE